MSTHDPLQRPWLAGHIVAQPVPSARQPNMQGIVDGWPQLPAPLQAAAVVSVLFVHEAAAPQAVVLPGNTQVARFCAVPSQRPAHTPVPGHAVRGVVTGRQLPRLPGTLQDSHWPAQAALQQ
jgi:hypothetical protein